MQDIVSTYSLQELKEELLADLKLFIREELEFDDKLNEELLTRKEAGAFLKITPPTLHEWTVKEIIPSYRFVGTNRIYYKKSEILKF